MNFINSHYHISELFLISPSGVMLVTSEPVAMEMTKMAQIHQHGPFSKQLNIFLYHKRNMPVLDISHVFILRNKKQVSHFPFNSETRLLEWQIS